MPHIHTEPGQIDHTVTAYIIRIDEDEPRALLHMHKKLGMLLPVGGHVELNETPWAAAAHEIEEESGYRMADLFILQPKHRIGNVHGVVVHPQPIFMNTHAITDEHYHSDTSYAFIAQAGPLQKLADGESSDLRWFTKAELQRLEPAYIWENTKLVYMTAFDLIVGDWERVTAASFSTGLPI